MAGVYLFMGDIIVPDKTWTYITYLGIPSYVDMFECAVKYDTVPPILIIMLSMPGKKYKIFWR